MRFLFIIAVFILPAVSLSQDTLVFSSDNLFFKVSKCSVGIVCVKKDSLWYYGTGFFVKDSSTIITAYHGIRNADSILYKSCRTLTELQIDTVYPNKDIAILKSNKPLAKPLEFGDYSDIKVRDTVVVMGYSEGFNITDGEVIRIYEEMGAKYIRYIGYAQTGFSGGPVFNLQGKVIGITLRGNKEEQAKIGSSEGVAIYLNINDY